MENGDFDDEEEALRREMEGDDDDEDDDDETSQNNFGPPHSGHDGPGLLGPGSYGGPNFGPPGPWGRGFPPRGPRYGTYEFWHCRRTASILKELQFVFAM